MTLAEEAKVVVLTTIPPRLSRFDSSGRQVGSEWLARCAKSWIDVGCQVVSINHVAEDLSTLEGSLAGDLFVARVKSGYCRDSMHPRPLLRDVLKLAGSLDRNPVVLLTNADVACGLDQRSLADIVLKASRGEMVVGCRTEVLDPGECSGDEYDVGFDFFAFPTGTLKPILSGNFALGSPWWDYVLPLNGLASGLVLHKAERGCVLHLRHETRWDGVEFYQHGFDVARFLWVNRHVRGLEQLGTFVGDNFTWLQRRFGARTITRPTLREKGAVEELSLRVVATVRSAFKHD
jgi:hypothetical protein